MKSFSIVMSIQQLQEIRDLVNHCIDHTSVLQEMSYKDLFTFSYAHKKLISKCQVKLFANQKRNYTMSFSPPDASILINVIMWSKINLNPYARATLHNFVEQCDKQSFENRQIYLLPFLIKKV